MNDPKKTIGKNMRDVERERLRLERDKQKKLTLVKQLALKGDHTQAKQVAKEIGRIDNQIKAMGNFNGQIRGVQSKVAGINSMNAMGDAMETSGKALAQANERIDMQKLKQNANIFQKEDMKLNMKQDMLDDVFDSISGEYDAMDEDVYNQVLSDAGIKSKTVQQQVKPLKNAQEVDDILNSLLKEQSEIAEKEKKHQKQLENAI